MNGLFMIRVEVQSCGELGRLDSVFRIKNLALVDESVRRVIR
jgi:hypothetical protein